MISDSNFNPYASPTADLRTENRRGCNTHYYDGRTIVVHAGYLPSRLWVLGEFTVTTDLGEVFKSAQASHNEDFQWSLFHKGRSVPCRLRTIRTINGHFSMPYELTLGDDEPTYHTIALSGAWWSLLMQVVVISVILAAAIAGVFAIM